MGVSATPVHLRMASSRKPTKNLTSEIPFKLRHTILLLQICRNTDELFQIHSLLVKTGLIQQKHALGRLLTFSAISNSGSLDYAHKVFAEIEQPNTFIFNTMIRAYSRSSNPKTAVSFYAQMLHNSIPPDEFTFTFLLTACSDLSSASEGKQAHAQIVKNPLQFRKHSQNSLVRFYSKFREIENARQVFDKIPDPDIVSWNSLLDGYVKSSELGSARRIFDEMPERDTVSWTSLLVGYAGAGLLEEARYMFDRMPKRNVVSWSAMICAYVRLGYFREALNLFEEMQIVGIEMDKIVMTTLLSSCANLGALDQGQWIHAYIDKHGIELDAHLSTALIDMYAKCGRINQALRIFRETMEKRVFVWNAVLSGLAMHSYGKEAIDLFYEMLEMGTKPNEITFICLLSACSHSGLVNDGLRIFHSMVEFHNVAPTIEHYGCVVDLLGRAGLLDEAKKIIETMPMQPDGSVWRSLLGACRIHGDFKLGEHVGKILIELEPQNDGNYVLLSNVYAMENRWGDVANLRRIMKVRGVNKMPGCSSIELNGVIHEFVAGDQSHPQSRDIYVMLDVMASQLLVYAYEPLEENIIFQN